MTALLEIKQKIKDFYGKFEGYLMPVWKFVLAFIYFMWINGIVGFSEAMSSIFVTLILSLLCAILPTNCIVLIGFVLMIGQCYALGIEIAAVLLVLIILLLILFLRFSPSANLAMIFTPLGYLVKIPMAVPVSAGLLGGPLSAAPAASGVILVYFLQNVRAQAETLKGDEVELPQKLRLLLDGMIRNPEMWISVAAFILVVLLVYLIRTRSLDFAWRIAIITGLLVYLCVQIAGGMFLNTNLSFVELVVGCVVSLIWGLLLEFFAYGGDYSRTEHLEFEDDDYFYYVKAVPKASINTSARKIKKINKTPEVRVPAQMPQQTPAQEPFTVQQDVDFEKKLEESLKDL